MCPGGIKEQTAEHGFISRLSSIVPPPVTSGVRSCQSRRLGRCHRPAALPPAKQEAAGALPIPVCSAPSARVIHGPACKASGRPVNACALMNDVQRDDAYLLSQLTHDTETTWLCIWVKSCQCFKPLHRLKVKFAAFFWQHVLRLGMRAFAAPLMLSINK